MHEEKLINKSDLAGLRRQPMVQALVELDVNTNRVLNVVKAKYNLKDKTAAIKFVVDRYIEDEEEPDLRPEFIEKMKKIAKGPYIKVGTIEELRKRHL